MALKYQQNGYCVIPINPYTKSPFFTTKEFQERHATEKEIQKWWNEFPTAMIGIMTGTISGIFVLDLDPERDPEQIKEFVPIDIDTPIAKTPRGGRHIYMEDPGDKEITIKASLFTGVDYRCNGGYIVAPPSKDSYGKQYRWMNGRSIFETKLAPVPKPLYDYILDYNKHSFNYSSYAGWDRENRSQPGLVTSSDFQEGMRDEALFHISNALVKGGMPKEEIEQVIVMFAKQCCDPPFPENEALTKVTSAIRHSQNKNRNIAGEVRDFLVTSNGWFLTSDVFQRLSLTSRDEKKAVILELIRNCNDGVIERDGTQNGRYRKIDRTIKEQCWWESKGNPVEIHFPLDIEAYAKIFPGNIILLEGQKSQGKSAFALEFCRLNKNLYRHKILYQNVEMSDDELLERFNSYGDVMTPPEWREMVTFIRQTGEWWDKIDPDGLNVIDYLVEYKESYLIADFVWRIHQKLKGGIALVVVQRDPMKPYPTGGRGVRDIPRLVISLIHHKLKLEDVKSFHQCPYGNPSGLIRKYKQANWWRFVPCGDWEKQEDEKYREFTIGG